MKNKKYGYFMYRDASNYKFLFECPIPEALETLEVDDETTFEQLGFDLNYVFGSIIKYPFNPNDDHNIVTLEEANDVVTHEDCFYDPTEPKEEINLIHNVVKIGDVDSKLLPEGLEKKLYKLETFVDMELDEYLFDVDKIFEEQQRMDFLNEQEYLFLAKLQKEMNSTGVAYFRIVNR